MNEPKPRHLELARRHIAEAERRVVAQYRHVRELEAAGASTAFARMLLDAFEDNLATLRQHLVVSERAHSDPWQDIDLLLQSPAEASRT